MKITSISNGRIKRLRSLYKKKYRRIEGAFVLEGVRIIEEACKEDALIEEVFYSDYLLRNQRGKDLLEKLKSKRVDVIEVSDKVLAEVSDTQSPQGILAVVKKVEYDLEDIVNGDENFLLVVDGVQDPGNLGTIIRTADAAGVAGIITTKGTVSLYNQKTIRATMGSLFRLPVYRENDLGNLKKILKDNKVRVIVGDIGGDKYHFDVDYIDSVALIVGNEGKGPRAELIEFADEVIKIPLVGDAESLNVAMATGVIVYEGVRQRLTKN
ncbi:TrmH family RNA methyltransferase [Halonatronum saccharophilum]|uniref:TrmH family RNA methyltransferase n=1 Tax=Halonatronum saccharophilum TaxID=150060 RepID=UPI00048A3043|nr:RNA methyltransferase [Halonatronum saccharophilum]